MNNKRLYISADIEGVAGVTTRDQLLPQGFEYQAARQWMTNEVVAACEAAFASGIEEIVVSGSHGNSFFDSNYPIRKVVRYASECIKKRSDIPHGIPPL